MSAQGDGSDGGDRGDAGDEALRFGPAVERAIVAAVDQAARRRHRVFQTEHLLRGLLDEPEARDILARCGADDADLAALTQDLDEYLDLVEPAPNAPRPRVDAACNTLLTRSAMLAKAAGRALVGVDRVLEQLIAIPDAYAAMLLRAAGRDGIDRVDLRLVISHGTREVTREVPAAARLRVFLHNDDYTSMEFVVAVLTELFGLPPKRAQALMLEIHGGPPEAGVEIAELPAKDAVRRVALVHDRARSQAFPLLCTLAAAS